MASIRKKNNKYEVRWRDLQRVEWSRVCPNKETAKALKLAVENSLALGRNWQPEGTHEQPSLTKALSTYLTVKQPNLKDRTFRRYGGNLVVFMRFVEETHPRRSMIGVDLLSKALLEDFFGWLLEARTGLHGRARSQDSARKIVEVVQLAWEWIEDSDRWPGMIPRPRRIAMKRSKPQPVVAPTWHEMDLVIGQLHGWHQHVGIVLRYTGLRVSEAMALVHDDINYERALLTIRPEISKTEVGRTVPISEHLIAEISKWGRKEGWLIDSGRRKGPRYRQVRARDFARAWERAGVHYSTRKQPTHSFRKGFKSGLLGMGATPDAVDYLQGHSLGGSRSRYIDPLRALPLKDVVSMIPKISTPADVVKLDNYRAAQSATVGYMWDS